jgi:hypothetical protein
MIEDTWKDMIKKLLGYCITIPLFVIALFAFVIAAGSFCLSEIAQDKCDINLPWI